MERETFGILVRQARRRSRLTQSELAKRMMEQSGQYIHQQQISYWECGTHRPSDRDLLLLLCQVLVRSKGIETVEEVQKLLHVAQAGALHPAERLHWFPQWAHEGYGAMTEPAQENGNGHAGMADGSPTPLLLPTTGQAGQGGGPPERGRGGKQRRDA